ncbi:MAG: aminoacyl-tRNA hydrolase [Chloroflexia bacterium]|nr:aminoacyl-tRNA hydrolase [Chloroflexia bacterium]
MKLIVGLGNPGREYANTRHNLGFLVADELLRRAGGGTFRRRFKADLVDIMHRTGKVVLVKPQTYMNLSGHSVREAATWYKVPRTDILIVLDDLDLPFGAIRMRAEGSAGGHNGLKSVAEQLGGRDVPRLRIGIGRGPGAATAQVLSRFAPEEKRALPEVIGGAADCCERWLDEGIIAAMNRCNKRELAAQEPA